MTKKILLSVLMLVMLCSVTPLSSATRVQKLSEARYLITLKKWSGYGGEGRVLRQLNIKAASLCVITGNKWVEITDSKSHGRGFVKTAAGTFEVKFYQEQENEDMLDCEALATDKEKQKMKKTLAKAK